jgi:hypothetical protein
VDEERRKRKNELAKAWYKRARAANVEEWRRKEREKQRAMRRDCEYGERLRARDRARYAKNRERIRAREKAAYDANLNGRRDKALAYHHRKHPERHSLISYRMRVAYNAAKSRAKTRGLIFDIGLADLGLPTHCAVTGIEFDLLGNVRKGGMFGPSIDRIKPELGYVKGNIRVVCYGYNSAKMSGNDDDVYKLAKAIVAYRETTHGNHA